MKKLYLSIRVISILSILILMTLLLSACIREQPYVDLSGLTYIDLSGENSGDERYNYLYDLITVDNSRNYLAHPDSILLNNGNILTMYPAGHGRGEILTKISKDNGLTWSDSLNNTPESWKTSEETPTVYRLKFNDNKEKLIMISANPKWPGYKSGDGFNASLSDDDGTTWTEFSKFYGKDSDFPLNPIVAMSSLIKLKENGQFTDKWMGIFHDNDFINYRTILTFDENGNMQWSKPEPYFIEHRDIEKKTAMCEVLIIRSDNGTGDELCLISRSNGYNGRKNYNSLISFSQDEGITWSEPREVPAPLSGERHKAVYSNGRLFITFRSIEREHEKVKQYRESFFKNWYSEGWVAWVGTYEDLKEGKCGQYRIKLAHTYLKNQTEKEVSANGDTGYAGVVLLNDNTIVTSSYGCFGEKLSDGSYKTYICSKRLKLEDLDELFSKE